jgi:rhodanese-related sulfurtransferase
MIKSGVGVVVLGILASFAGLVYAQGSARSITPAEALAMLKGKSPLTVLDVRTDAEYRAGFLAGAKNVDVTRSGFEQAIAKLDKRKPVLVYCAVGGRSAKAARILKDNGFVVFDLAGGYTAWQQARYPVQR